ncbi:tetratricopeptide repeat protein [Vicingus serpentipes]|uniref:Tetratricopeptide repeat protein n=1 Tax=Vicingus serpentipes TaxID=1926625 RepID=A0A5C6RRD3_9FLAO|nr:tetratricopeptide repeat protein [Vicingus serpentipes]TXB64549.1 tetratricopeptide repeat protein [Vicingus serpentipes]
MKNFVILIYLLLTFSGICFSQPKQLNSFIHDSTVVDTLRLKKIFELVEYHHLHQLDSSVYYWKIAQEIVNKSTHKYWKAESHLWGAWLMEQKGNLSYALENYFEALSIYEEINDLQGVAVTQNNIATIYKTLGEYDSSLEFHYKSLKNRSNIKDSSGIANSLNNIAQVYFALGEIDSSLFFHKQSYKIAKSINDDEYMGVSLNDIGIIHKNRMELDSAFKYISMAYDITKNSLYKNSNAAHLNNLAQIQILKGNYQDAKIYAEKSYEIAKELSYPRQIAYSSLTLSKVYQALKNYKKGLELYQTHMIMKDSVINQDVLRKSINEKAKYEYEKEKIIREEKFKAEKKLLIKEKIFQNRISFFIAITLVLSFIFILILIKRYKTIKQQKELIIQANNKAVKLEKEKHELELLNKIRDIENLNNQARVLISFRKKLIEQLLEVKRRSENNKELSFVITELKTELGEDQKRLLLNDNDKIGSEFNNRLLVAHPKLSKTELEICSLLTLNLSTKELANIRNTSINTINVAKSRIRKKINLNQDDDLVTYLKQI